MTLFVYVCPITKQPVQHWLDRGGATRQNEAFVAVPCQACARLHFLNPRTGRLLGDKPRRKRLRSDEVGPPSARSRRPRPRFPFRGRRRSRAMRKDCPFGPPMRTGISRSRATAIRCRRPRPSHSALPNLLSTRTSGALSSADATRTATPVSADSSSLQDEAPAPRFSKIADRRPVDRSSRITSHCSAPPRPPRQQAQPLSPRRSERG